MTTYSPAETALIITLRRQVADLERQVDELRAAVAALLAPDHPEQVLVADPLWQVSDITH